MNNIKIHVIFWIVYFLLKTYNEFVWIYPSYEELTWSSALWTSSKAQASMLPIKIIYVYWFVYVFLTSKSKIIIKVLYFIAITLLALLIFRLFVVYITLPFAYNEIPENQPIFTLTKLISNAFDLALLCGVASSLIFYKKHQDAKLASELLKKEKISNELMLLKQQTNPHFLFNTLNNLYGLARKESKKTAESILKLSNLLKFMLYEVSKERIPVYQEIKVINEFIALEKLRYGDRVEVEFDVDCDRDDYSISPLLILPLFENAFKYGASDSLNKAIIKSTLLIENNNLNFTIYNNYNQNSKNSDGNGLGLKNLQRQLNLLYPKHSLQIDKGRHLFTCKLSIKI